MKKKKLIFVALLCFILNTKAQNSKPTSVSGKLISSSGQNPFTAFPAGKITTLGWLKGMENMAIKGYTGHMEDINAKASRKRPVDAWGSANVQVFPAGKLEQEGYYLDGLVRLAYISHDEALIKKAKSKIDPVIARQEKDGFFLHPENRPGFYEIWTNDNLADPHYFLEKDVNASITQWKDGNYMNLQPSRSSRYHWACAVFNRAVLALYDASKDEKYINFLYRYYVNLPEFVKVIPDNIPFSGTEMHGDRNLVELEVLFGVADRLHDTELRDKGLRILKNKASGIQKSFFEKKFKYVEIVHGVTFNELLKLYASTENCNNKEYLQSCENAFDFLKTNHMQPYGVNSANEYLGGVGGFTSTELCNISDIIWSSEWLMKATGKASYSDYIEKAFFNAFPASIDKYQKHVYMIAPNRLSGIKYKHRVTKHDFEHTHAPFCCTTNLNRVLPNYVMHMIMKTQDNGLAFLLYGPNQLNAQVNNKAVRITTTTNYPFRDEIKINIDENKAGEFPLYLKIPDWCTNAKILFNGKFEKVNEDSNGLTYLKKDWKKGDEITLTFPMKATIVKDRERTLIDPKTNETMYTGPGQSRVADTAITKIGAPYAYISRGPLLYTLAFKDQDSNTPVSTTMDYQYALLPKLNVDDISIKENPINNSWIWTYDNAPVEMTVKAQKVSWECSEYGSLPDSKFKLDNSKMKQIKIIPFGCGKFRMTMFPVAE